MPGVFHSKQAALGESVPERFHGCEKWLKHEHRDALGSIIVHLLGSKGVFLMFKIRDHTHSVYFIYWLTLGVLFHCFLVCLVGLVLVF